MNIYEFQGADGQTFEIEAPDEQSAMSAFQSSQAPQPSQSAQGIAPTTPPADTWTPSKRQVPDGWNEIAQTDDGGSVYEAPNGSRQFVSPSYSTQKPEEIDQIMQQGNLRTPPVNTGEGIARGAFQGATLNFGDELVAGAGAALDPLVNNTGNSTFSERYDARVGNERNKIDQFREEKPMTALGSEITGALAAGGGIAGAGLSASAKANNLRGLMAGGAIDGAVFGAASGAGAGEDGNRSQSAIAGGLVGGGTGFATPLAIAGVQRMAQPVIDGARTAFAPPQVTVQHRMAKAMREAGKSNDEIATELSKLGDEGMLVDVLGSSGEGLARSASNTNPAARNILENAVNLRKEGQSDRLVNKLLESSGLDEPTTIDNLIDAQRRATQPALNAEYRKLAIDGFDLPDTPFRDILKSKMISDAVEKAEANVLEDAVISGQQAGSRFSVLDEAKKVLDDQARASVLSGHLNESRLPSALAKTLRERVTDLLPNYGNVRALAATAAKGREAIKLGAKLANPQAPADFAKQLQGFTPEQSLGAAQGYAATKINQIQTRTNSPLTPFTSPRQKSVLQEVLGKRAGLMQQQLANEKVFNGTARGIQGNSSTARQLMEMGAIGGGAGLVAGGDGTSAGIGALSAIAARKAGGAALRQATASKEQQIAPIIAEILTGKMPAQQVQKMVEKNPVIGRALTRALSLQTGGSAGASANQ